MPILFSGHDPLPAMNFVRPDDGHDQVICRCPAFSHLFIICIFLTPIAGDGMRLAGGLILLEPPDQSFSQSLYLLHIAINCAKNMSQFFFGGLCSKTYHHVL